jgi:hypothetical protein
MKQLLTFVLILFVTGLFAQNVEIKSPDYRQIEKNIQKKGSPLFYKKLMKRFIASDTTFTLKEKRHLYYGYSFQPNYSPYERSEYEDKIRGLLNQKEISVDELYKIVSLCDSSLVQYPLDLRCRNYQLYALDQLKLIGQFNQKIIQMRIIYDAMLSSGDGLSKKTAFYVINARHEYDILNALGFKFGGMQSLIDHYDYLELADNPQNIEGMYFDITPCLNSMKNMFK